ncbi:MAG: hypothetical protein ACFFCI_04275 [Promethearchaeota archaeon]
MIPIIKIPFLGELDFDWDSYFRMSNDITSIFRSEIVAPFCYRPLMPLLAGILPFDLKTSYFLINFISVYLTGILLYFTLRIQFSRLLSIVGLFFFCFLNYIEAIYRAISFFYFSPFYHIYFYEIYNVDTLSILFLMICFYCILSSKNSLYSVFLVLGILTKETILFTIPIFLLHIYVKREKPENKKRRYIKSSKSVIYILPGIIVYTLMHIYIIPKSIIGTVWDIYYQGNEYLSFKMVLIFVKMRITDLLEGNGLFQWTVGTWGLMLILLVSLNSKKEIFKWIKYYGIFMVLIYSQMFFGIAVKKYIYYGFFPMIYLGVSGLNCLKNGFENYFNYDFLIYLK